MNTSMQFELLTSGTGFEDPRERLEGLWMNNAEFIESMKSRGGIRYTCAK